MRHSIRHCVPTTFLFLAGVLAGCAPERPESVPASAQSIVRQTGSNPIKFTAQDDGRVYVFDRSIQKMVYSSRLTRGETLELDPRRDGVRVDGVRVVDAKLRDLNEYQVWFNKEPAPREVKTASATVSPTATPAAGTAGVTAGAAAAPVAGTTSGSGATTARPSDAIIITTPRKAEIHARPSETSAGTQITITTAPEADPNARSAETSAGTQIIINTPRKAEINARPSDTSTGTRITITPQKAETTDKADPSAVKIDTPAKSDAAKADTVKTESATTDSATTDSATTDSAKGDSAKTDTGVPTETGTQDTKRNDTSGTTDSGVK